MTKKSKMRRKCESSRVANTAGEQRKTSVLFAWKVFENCVTFNKTAKVANRVSK